MTNPEPHTTSTLGLFDEPACEKRDGIERAARFSECGTWRYYLSRHWSATGEVQAFVMLNPSTADHRIDDATIRRCMAFAGRDGYAGIAVLNLFAYRATDPKAMRAAADPVGPQNDDYLRLTLTKRVHRGLPVVAAWGAHPGIEQRVRDVLALVRGVDWRCLGRTKHGAPRHPLYVRADEPLVPLFGASS